MEKLALKGIKVADFTWVWTGPTTTKVLADFGATVLRIESGNRLGVWRITPPFKDDIQGPDRGAVFNSINTGKLSITIDLTKPEGKDLAKKFVAWADIVTDNFSGGVMERMGLGYETLKQIKSDIIMMSSSLMGQTGPWHTSPGYGDQLSAISGLHEISGWPDRTPGEIGFYTDFIAPRFNAMTILAALDYRKQTGEGQYLDVAQYQSGVQFMAPLVLDYIANNRVATRQGNADAYAAPHGFYSCKGDDRWCAIAVFTQEQWEKFCDEIGRPAWTKDPKFATLELRQKNASELDERLNEWTRNLSDDEVMNRVQKAGIGAGRLGTTEDQMENDPQLLFRNFYQEQDHPEIGKYRPPRQPCVLSKTPCKIKRAPLLGEHSEYALREILGLTDSEIENLIISEVIQ